MEGAAIRRARRAPQHICTLAILSRGDALIRTLRPTERDVFAVVVRRRACDTEHDEQRVEPHELMSFHRRTDLKDELMLQLMCERVWFLGGL